MRTLLSFALALVLLATACGSDATPSAGVELTTTDHIAAACAGVFHVIDLPHTTSGSGTTTSLFDGTGSGVAAEDLNDDGQIDIVLANLSGESTVLWNNGDMTFDPAPLTVGRFRHVSIVDLDVDGTLDIVMSTGIGIPLWFRQDPATNTFTSQPIPNVDAVSYSMAWADIGGDGDLDLLTGGYNAELTANRDVQSLLGTRGGVFFYENIDGAFVGEQLTDLAQALVVRLTDIDGDSNLDAWVGNDLATPDELFLGDGGSSWTGADLLPASTFSTMSLDRGDLDNDGDEELFSTDMHPMDNDPETVAAWEPIMEDMASQPIPESVQRMENVVLAPSGGSFDDIDLGVAFTGWSWSGLLGDLDLDGSLDAYVVNGMEAESLFSHLDGSALVEPNQAFRNLGDGMMEPMPDWGLADTAGGRGMAMADFDRDGDLDIVVNNLNAPSRLFENRLCAGGNALTIALDWSGAADPRAIGATVTVVAGDATMVRTLETTRGYLSTSPAEAHFGLGSADNADVSVHWPDGTETDLGSLPSGTHTIAHYGFTSSDPGN